MFKEWKLGTINIRSGKEKDEGAKIYSIAKQLASNGVSICCLQEVRYRRKGTRLIKLDTGEVYEFHWCGMQKKRLAGVGLLIRKDENIIAQDPDFQDPRIIALNLIVHGFRIRLVNGYSPTECDMSERKKDEFYNRLKKACIKKEKHQKLIVVGDFNAKTGLALKKCCYDGTNIIEDTDCNGNGSRMKDFCRKNKLCIASSFFDYSPQNRYTWYSPDGVTVRVNDYVLTEKFVQEYNTSCKAEPDIDFESDHRILIAEFKTPSTKRARMKPKRVTVKPKADVSAFRDTTTSQLFQDSVKNTLARKGSQSSPSDLSEMIVNTLISAGDTSLPKTTKKETHNNIWRTDAEFNRLLNERQKHRFGSNEYKQVTKDVKKRIKHLRNEKLRSEAEEINEHANRRKVEELYRCMKSDFTAFKVKNNNSKCDPNRLSNYFKDHFNETKELQDPIELNDAPDYIKILQGIDVQGLNTLAPNSDEIKLTVKRLKNCKSATDIPAAYIKHAIDCKEFSDEMAKLYDSIWATNKIPKSWTHSKLIAIWKCASKGSRGPNCIAWFASWINTLQNPCRHYHKPNQRLV